MERLTSGKEKHPVRRKTWKKGGSEERKFVRADSPEGAEHWQNAAAKHFAEHVKCVKFFFNA